MSDIYTLAAQNLRELNQLDSRTSAVRNSVQVSINESDKCLVDWNRLRKAAEDILSGITNCIDEINSMNRELTDTVNQLGHLNREIYEIENQTNQQRTHATNLEARYLILKCEVKNAYFTIVKLLEDLQKTVGFNNPHLMNRNITLSEIEATINQQNNTFRITPEFRTPLFEPVYIPSDLLFESVEKESSTKDSTENNFSTDSSNNQSRNQQENA